VGKGPENGFGIGEEYSSPESVKRAGKFIRDALENQTPLRTLAKWYRFMFANLFIVFDGVDTDGFLMLYTKPRK
jgi:hypothetical protein